MGIETWAVVALGTILAVYLLPFLVGRREAMRMANAEDRYSAGLRVLAAGSAAAPGEECGGGHAMIFRRRPEVRAMNRPEVRNVRALRKERELARLRQAHERGRERRRVAAAHRAAVALTLLGVTLGTLAVAAVTALPWWAVAVPGALLGASAVAGRRAALAAAESERRERRRITAVERELTALTGGGSSGNRTVERATGQTTESGLSHADAEAPEQEAASEPLARRALMDSLKGAGRVHSAVTRAVTRVTTAQDSPAQADTMDPVRAASARDEADDEVSEANEPDTARLETDRRQTGESSATGVPTEETDVTADDGAARETQDESRDTQESRDTRESKAPATPPQGWHPVSVPAPTYTLAARAPRRSYAPPAEEPFDSVPVPERPRNAHTYPSAGVEAETDEPVFHPIDLEAVLERRRAGA